MLRLLSSNQPAAWVIVPMTAVLLWGISAMGVRGEIPGSGEALSFLAILASARILHLSHLESRMRTRPTSIPGWAFVLWSVPLIAGSPTRLWWAGFFVLAGLREGLRLGDDDARRSRAFFWMGIHLGLAGVLWPAMSVWSLLVPVGCLILRSFRPAETLSLIMGLSASWGGSLALPWLMEFSLPSALPGVQIPWREWTVLLLWLPFGCTGWLLRQQSLARATARQRTARRLTQWVAGAGLLMALWGILDSTGAQGAAQVLFSGGVFCAWSLGWCCPPWWKATPSIPWILLALAVAVTVWPWWLTA